MTCGQSPHPPGTPPHEHPEATTEATATPKSRGLVRTVWARHHRAMTPFMVAPAVDAYATACHFTAGDWWKAAVATLGAGTAAEIAAEIRNWRGKRRPAVRSTARKTVAAATAWGLVGSTWFPHGLPGLIAQGALLVPGTVAAAVHVRGSRRPAPPAPETPAGIEPPPDPRLEAFRRRFCEGAHAPLRDAWAGAFTPLSRGFSLEVKFHEDSAHTIADVARMVPLIAKLYDTSLDNVAVGYVPEHRSEARAQVVVHTATPAERKQALRRDRWDGESTYDAATGTIRLGTYLDDEPVRYLLHRPRSGAAMGMAAGIPGGGKTGTLNVITAEAGLAKMCVHCGGARTCPECDLRRIAAIWTGDAQAQGLGIWKGKADLVGWGPEGCLELLQLAATVAKARQDYLGSLEWTDHRGRRNIGKGWFDPEPGFPLIFLTMDEWPLLVKDKELGTAAIAFAVMAVTTWRKIGIHLMLGTQVLDVSQTGVREIRELIKFFNLIAHRADQVSGQMGGIKGDPTKLPPGEAGAGYISGYDNRPDAKFGTKFCPDYAERGDTGMDIRDLAEVIAGTPVEYDQPVTQAMEVFGLSHQQVITEWRGRDGVTSVPMAAAVPAAQPGPGIEGLPTSDEAMAVGTAIGQGDTVTLYHLMQTTGLPVRAVSRALEFLTANGDVTRVGEDQYAATPAA